MPPEPVMALFKFKFVPAPGVQINIEVVGAASTPPFRPVLPASARIPPEVMVRTSAPSRGPTAVKPPLAFKVMLLVLCAALIRPPTLECTRPTLFVAA